MQFSKSSWQFVVFFSISLKFTPSFISHAVIHLIRFLISIVNLIVLLQCECINHSNNNLKWQETTFEIHFRSLTFTHPQNIRVIYCQISFCDNHAAPDLPAWSSFFKPRLASAGFLRKQAVIILLHSKIFQSINFCKISFLYFRPNFLSLLPFC